MAKTLEETQYVVAEHMDAIIAEFKAGRRITVLVRSPGNEEGDFLMTDDDLEEAKALIQRRIERGHEGGSTKG